jgi:hypothetical protein
MMAIDARPGGPTAKRQPSPEGLGNRSRRGSERRRRGTQPIVRSPCVIRSVPGFFYFTALTSATFVVLPKENHMQLTEDTTLDRKSGEAEVVCSFSTRRQPQARNRFIYSASTLSASMIGPWNSSCSTKA